MVSIDLEASRSALLYVVGTDGSMRSETVYPGGATVRIGGREVVVPVGQARCVVSDGPVERVPGASMVFRRTPPWRRGVVLAPALTVLTVLAGLVVLAATVGPAEVWAWMSQPEVCGTVALVAVALNVAGWAITSLHGRG